MTALLRSVGLMAFAALAWTLSAAAQRPPAVPANGLIVGQVVDGEGGRPVGQATVWLGGTPNQAGVIPQATPTRILTGSDGRFVFRDLPPAAYTVMASRRGYLPGASGRRHPNGTTVPILLTTSRHAAEAVVRVWRSASISGTLTDEAGEPLVSVQVDVLRRVFTGGRPRFSAIARAFTDDRGNYRAGNLPPGHYIAGTSAPSLAFSLDTARELTRPGGEGHPMPPLVQVDDFVYLLGGGRPTPPPPGDGRLRVYPTTFYPGTDSAAQAGLVTLRAGDDYTGADVQLRPSEIASVRGQIVGRDSGNSPLLQLIRTDSSTLAPDLAGAMTPTTTSGNFLFPAVPDGDYVLRVIDVTRGGASLPPNEPRATLWAAEPVTVRGEDLTVVAVLREGLRVHGYVEFMGSRLPPSPTALSQIPVAVEPAFGAPLVSTAGSSASLSTLVQPGGEFSTPGVPGGAYVIRVTNSPQGWMFRGTFYGGRDISTEAMELTTDIRNVVLQFTDRWTGLQGTVRDARSQPDPDAVVLAFPLDPSAWEGYGPSPRRLRLARTSPTGTYAMDGLPPGDYYAIAVHDEDADQWRDPELLTRLSRSAIRFSVRADGKTTLDLRTQEVER